MNFLAGAVLIYCGFCAFQKGDAFLGIILIVLGLYI